MLDQLSERSGKFVVPGNKLGVVEEVLPGQGTYVDNGIIHSLTTGNVRLDLPNRRISVPPSVRQPLVPKVGNTVSGLINNVQEKSAEIRILNINGKSVGGFFSGILHVSNVSERFVKTMFDAFRPGDVIRARVISAANRVFHLTTEEPTLGVTYAFCSHCGRSLNYRDRTLRCATCGRIERRKTATDYWKT